MLALQIELLTGTYFASSYNDRGKGEWPPHPARLFSALVEAWATGEPGSADGEEELQALRWLEQQTPPSIAASPLQEVGHRSKFTVFVPVNDIATISQPSTAREKLEVAAEAAINEVDPKAKAKASASVEKLRKKLVDDTAKSVAVPAKFSESDVVSGRLIQPEHRLRQGRTFPAVTPADPRVRFIWNESPPSAARAGLERLLRRLVRLGHSSSLVAATIADESGEPTFIPDDTGGMTLRVTSVGQTERLIEAFRRHAEVEPRVLPCAFQRYRAGVVRKEPCAPQSSFDREWIVFARVGGPRLSSTSVAGVARQFRRALLSVCEQPVPEMLSGHDASGAALGGDHLAIVPLVDVAHDHAQGSILGLALIVPRGATAEARETLLRAIGRLETDQDGVHSSEAEVSLMLGRAGVLQLRRVEWGKPKAIGLRSEAWCNAARTWITAVPIALDKNPGDLHDDNQQRRSHAFAEAEGSIRAAVEHLGLPAPTDVVVTRSCLLPGTAKPRTFPPFPIENGRIRRVLVHARLRFEQPVQGPLLLGAGRYYGLGLCRPIDPGSPT